MPGHESCYHVWPCCALARPGEPTGFAGSALTVAQIGVTLQLGAAMDWLRLVRELRADVAGGVTIAGFALSVVCPAAAQTSDRPTCAPRNLAFEQYTRDLGPSASRAQSEAGSDFGLVPPPLDLSHNRGKRILAQTNMLASFPASYDLRTQVPSKLSPVRNQGGCGSCWAFASYGSLESCILPGQSYDFSENHLKNTHGFDWTCCEGGNHWISTAYLAGWSGPALESSDPYNGSSCTSPPGVPAVKHVQRVDFLPDRAGSLDNDNIKQAVMNYGAVYTTYYHGGAYYNSSTFSYYYNGSAAANHAVCIVGWNDNYDKSRFVIAPPANGAFIVRNSWGPGWGEGGYFYVSYCDTLFGRENAVFNNADQTSNYNQIYQYDPYGWVNSLGYGATTAWFANVFAATSDTDLKAASFYVGSPQSPYEFRVYLDPNSGPVSTGGPVATKTGTIANCGYQTIVLDAPVFVPSGHRFSVVVKLTTPGYVYPVPFEELLFGYSSAATANPGESYISPNGSSWTDLTSDFPNSNVCIKAFGAAIGGISVQPATGLASDGPAGGPFGPLSQTYTLTNNGLDAVNWSAGNTSSWVALSSTGGTLGPGQSATVTVSIGSSAGGFAPGLYDDTVAFTNTTNGLGNTTRGVTLAAYADYEISSVPFGWIDPISHTQLHLSDDGVSPAQAIPFEFRFYEKPYAQLYVGANGLIGFVNLNLNSYTNTDIPNPTAPNAALYPYWDDLNPGVGGTVRIGTVGAAPNRKLAISWVGVPPYPALGSPLTFQVVLCEGSNDVIFQYLDVKPGDSAYGAGRRATVGVENGSGKAAARYSYNGSSLLGNGRAILFTSRGATTTAMKLLADNASAVTRRAIVTKVFDESFYIESDDRVCGIRVTKPGHDLAAGMRADVSGVLKTNSDGERCIEAQWTSQSGEGSVAPLGLGSAAIGGGSLSYDSQTGAGQQGMKAWHKVTAPGGGWQWEPFDLPGPNNMGLLISTWGRVSWTGSDEFYVDDGWGVRDVSEHAGIRVYAPGLTPPLGAFVRLVGVVSCYNVGGSVYRVIRVADESDVVVPN